MLDAHAAFMRFLEKLNRLNRAVEYLPAEDEVAERRLAKLGLTAPESAVLLAYSKMWVFDELVPSELVADEYVARTLVGYFPTLLQTQYAGDMSRHRLKSEITATVIANTMINRTGSTFVHRMMEETGASAVEVTRAYILVRDIYGLDALWHEVDALDNRVPAQVQYEMLIEVGRLLLRATLWFLRRRREKLAIAQVLGIFQPTLEQLRAHIPGLLSEGDRAAWTAAAKTLQEQGVPQPLAERVASLSALYAALDVTEVAVEQKKTPEAVAALYFSLVGELELRWFWDRITDLPTDTQWQALARNAMRDDLSSQQRALTASVAKMSDEGDPAKLLAAWKERYSPAITRLKTMTEELKRSGTMDLAVLSVLLRELRALA
jgi:glutamate dehydrogenase